MRGDSETDLAVEEIWIRAGPDSPLTGEALIGLRYIAPDGKVQDDLAALPAPNAEILYRTIG